MPPAWVTHDAAPTTPTRPKRAHRAPSMQQSHRVAPHAQKPLGHRGAPACPGKVATTMDVTVIGELITVSTDDDTTYTPEVLADILKRTGDEALRIHRALASTPDGT